MLKLNGMKKKNGNGKKNGMKKKNGNGMKKAQVLWGEGKSRRMV